MASNYRKTQISPVRQLSTLVFALMAVWGVISFLKKLPSHPAGPAAVQAQQIADSGSKIGGLLDSVRNPFSDQRQQPKSSIETAPAAAKGFAPQPDGFEVRAEEDSKLNMRDRLARHYTE